MSEYYNDQRDLNRVYIFKNSKEYFDRFTTFYTDWLRKLSELSFESLNQEDKVDYILLKRNIQNDQYLLNQNKIKWEQVQHLFPFSPEIINLQQKRRRGQTLIAREVAATLDGVIRSIEDTKKIGERKPLANEDQRKLALEMAKELQRGLKNVHSFYNSYDPQYSWWMKRTYPQTDSALSGFSQWLSRQSVQLPGKPMDSTGIIGNPVGRTEIERQLKFQMIPYSPEELIKIANEQYDWCETEMKKASRQMGYGDDWKKALEKVKEGYLEPGKQPELINQLEENAIRLIDSLGLITIPALAREVWRMDMLSPDQMRFASYFLGGEQILIAYPHEAQDYETKRMIMRSGNRAFAHAEVFHELIPGHNLQFYMNNRYRAYRDVFFTPFSVEGWALYWEMILWDNGYNQTPQDKIGALFWRMTRCARIIFSLNYHLGNWTPQQCIDLLVEKGRLEKFSAEAEVRRSFTGGYEPLYQIAYMVGAIQLYGLHKEMVKSGKLTNKQFNDTFLHEGIIPVEMFRAIIKNQKLEKNFITNWRFADK